MNITLADIFPEPVEKPDIPKSLGLGDYLWHAEDTSAYVLSTGEPDTYALVNVQCGFRRRAHMHINSEPFGRADIVKLLGGADRLADYEYLGHGIDGLRAALKKLEAVE